MKYTIESVIKALNGTPLQLLVPHIERVFFSPPLVNPELEKLYVLAKDIEEKTEELARRLSDVKRSDKLWLLLRVPLLRLIQHQKLNSRGVRQQFEQVIFGGDPYYTGVAEEGEKRIERMREIHRTHQQKGLK